MCQDVGRCLWHFTNIFGVVSGLSCCAADAFIILSFRINFSNTFELDNYSILENILLKIVLSSKRNVQQKF